MPQVLAPSSLESLKNHVNNTNKLIYCKNKRLINIKENELV